MKDEKDEEDEDSDDAFANLFVSEYTDDADFKPPPVVPRTLYIQMEFVERQTLKEACVLRSGITGFGSPSLQRIAESLSEDEAWRLFYQILEALVHMGSMGILHRDIKLTNIFIVGDFGLATSSLAAVDPSDLSPHVAHSDSDMTLDVGTKLYIAPEVLSRSRGPRNHNKADMYSLGIVFFEMNYMFSTGSERIAVIEDLRKPEIYFPHDWDRHRTRQKDIITLLLHHDPAKRPSALELSQSSLLPPRMEDEYFKGALKMMAKKDSPYYQGVLSTLFNQPGDQVRSFLYDFDAEVPEHAYLNTIVEERLSAIFRLHGALDMEPSLLVPSTGPEDSQSQATYIDRHGDIVCLPNNALVPFARLAARNSTQRIKRFHISNIYRPNSVPGHPRVTKAAVLDIITPDVTSCIVAASQILSKATRSIFHIQEVVVELALSRIPEDLRASVIDIINQSKSSASQKRASLLKKGLLRSTADELEVLAEIDEDIDGLLAKLGKISPWLSTMMKPAVEEIKECIQYASLAGFNGYDNLIKQYSTPKPKSDQICAVAVQIALEKITVALAAYQSTSVKTLSGYLQDRLEVAALLWQNNISADILFTVYPRPRTGRRDQAAFKVKSILKGTEYEVSRQDLVSWLQQQIAEQKRIDLSTSGASNHADMVHTTLAGGGSSTAGDVQLVLPVDAKKQRKQVKQILLDRAYERSTELKAAIQNGVPMIAVDVPSTVFDGLVRSSLWVQDDEAWKIVVASMPAMQSAYSNQIRDAVARRKLEGHAFVVLYATREERMQLLSLT
ncbi:hypothetical protein ID866_8983 [Astraeus odoratus]|nr:hypothetical protein ID866_8983 [Astraeus odoratus]